VARDRASAPAWQVIHSATAVVWRRAARSAHTARVSALLDLLVPERCAACRRPGRGLCGPCLHAAAGLRLTEGAPVRLGPGVLGLSPFVYDGVVARAIRNVKTPGRHAAAVWLGALLWAELLPRLGVVASWPRTWVPSGRARLRERGAEIPRLLAGDGALPMVRRVRQAGDQKRRSARERMRAPVGDFVALGPVPKGVVMVDDVRTTGATARAAAAALQSAGAARVVAVSLAAVRDPDTINPPSLWEPYDAYNGLAKNG
jgi:predicted amidophosphoribosyltransferase